eukprot:TRINITY_DN4037_c0_g3_i4.p2 TRINITY_DN4037_c0_g3~~TRINITY_DN4037_c0_g3_i4.p2  ORF type:complete len:232 (-),score=38.49 TRINITY_DN4037_c0_g3_i4:938-1633(-)
MIFPGTISDKLNGEYVVQFKPTVVGKIAIDVSLEGGAPLSKSPYTAYALPGLVTRGLLSGKGLGGGPIRKPLSFGIKINTEDNLVPLPVDVIAVSISNPKDMDLGVANQTEMKNALAPVIAAHPHSHSLTLPGQRWIRSNPTVGSLPQLPQAIIARINGSAMGGGWGLLFTTDIRISLQSAEFSFAEGKRGIVPAIISTCGPPTGFLPLQATVPHWRRGLCSQGQRDRVFN